MSFIFIKKDIVIIVQFGYCVVATNAFDIFLKYFVPFKNARGVKED